MNLVLHIVHIGRVVGDQQCALQKRKKKKLILDLPLCHHVTVRISENPSEE